MNETKRFNIKDINEAKSKALITEAAQLLRAGQTVAFPTETVYGLGADATNSEAVARIFQAKGRPQDNPLIAHVATKEQLKKLVTEIPDYVDKLIEKFSPGPITYVLPSNGACVDNVTAGLSTIGVRIPDHPIAIELLKACNVPIAAPSANLSGKPSPTSADHVWQDLNGRIAGIVDGGPTGVGVESTVVDCTQKIPIILRPGGVTREELENTVGPVMMDPALVDISENEKPRAPGMKYTHYAPEVPLWIIDGPLERMQEVINEQRKIGNRVGVLLSSASYPQIQADNKWILGDHIQEIASKLYDGLRYYKQSDVDIIICESFPDEGLGQAVMNRLRKAASVHLK
ncbi:L-threonylcarbamoyladenylate synthase [Ornithinibacillus halophilus]|uniref:Threonylcarbamoyl-AMP synthase n=1 Tax=Ornithinibacillus halophilus TaxID=930117 RepID=A0A1M5NL92_9BACI|nr:L-threonylcarbamoyladenylate synthase [Ornithinibacillus halophilus]SHG89693.1 translation factor SUA5 [Ornithinibacillus halophilus]